MVDNKSADAGGWWIDDVARATGLKPGRLDFALTPETDEPMSSNTARRPHLTGLEGTVMLLPPADTTVCCCAAVETQFEFNQCSTRSRHTEVPVSS